jgi:hypothetical protein
MSYIALETSLEELKFDFLRTLREILVYEILAHLKVQDLKTSQWTLQKNV